MGNPKKAISHLYKKKKEIVDDLAFNELLYKLHLKVQQNDKAIEHLEELLRLNSSNTNYYTALLKAKGVSSLTVPLSEEDQ